MGHNGDSTHRLQTKSGQHIVNEMKEGQHLQAGKMRKCQWWHMDSDKQCRVTKISRQQTSINRMSKEHSQACKQRHSKKDVSRERTQMRQTGGGTHILVRKKRARKISRQEMEARSSTHILISKDTARGQQTANRMNKGWH
jgi:hypothetical protein